MLHAGNQVIMRVWCMRLNGTQQMSAAAMMACKRSYGVCVRCASNTQHALSPWKAGLSSVERGWMVPTPAWRLECRDEFAGTCSSLCLRNVQTMSSRQRPGGAAPGR